MGRWIDAPTWHTPEGKDLRSVLVSGHLSVGELRALCATSGIDLNDVGFGGTARESWAYILELAKGDVLAAVIEGMIEQRGALEPRLRPFLTLTTVDAVWYQAGDAYAPRLFGPGTRRALFNRSALSRRLKQVVESGYLVFSIRGDPGSGRSHTRVLLSHVIRESGSPSCQVIQLDVATEWPDELASDEINASEFARVLAQKIPINATFVVDAHTHASRISRDLANQFVAQYRRQTDMSSWIFCDGLDRALVGADVHEFIGHLAWAAATEQLGETRLIVTGFQGGFAPDVEHVLVEEEIERITREHVVTFFEEIAGDCDCELGPDEAEALADAVIEQSDLEDLRALERAAVAAATQRFGGL